MKHLAVILLAAILLASCASPMLVSDKETDGYITLDEYLETTGHEYGEVEITIILQ